MRQRKFPWVPIGCSCCHVHAICLLCEWCSFLSDFAPFIQGTTYFFSLLYIFLFSKRTC